MSRRTKVIFAIALFISWAIFVAIIVAGLLYYPASKNLKNNNVKTVDSVSQNLKLTPAEISKHETRSDCWVIIDNKVYDLTNFLKSHSGGADSIIPYCGKDGTNAFNTKDKTPSQSHNSNDIGILDSFYMGDVNMVVNISPEKNTLEKNNSINNVQTDFVQNSIKLTIQEVSKHNTANDCWLIIGNKIYDVTSYLNKHPGSAGTIIPYCGKDGTEAFATKDKASPTSHSSYADNLLNSYYIGDLNQVLNENVIQNRINASISNSQNISRSGEDDDYEEDD